MTRRDGWILTFMALVLLSVNLGYEIFNQPPAIAENTLSVPAQLADWRGVDVQHTEGERAVLGNVDLIKRTYTNTNQQYVWLIMHQTPAVSRLHNVYVSLIASGSKPAVLGERKIESKQGPLVVSQIKTVDADGNTRYGYLWYQWQNQSGKAHYAANRWRWYAGVLMQRASGYIPAWQLVEIFTPADDPETAWQRLDTFARQIYELAGETSSGTSSGKAKN